VSNPQKKNFGNKNRSVKQPRGPVGTLSAPGALGGKEVEKLRKGTPRTQKKTSSMKNREIVELQSVLICGKNRGEIDFSRREA